MNRLCVLAALAVLVLSRSTVALAGASTPPPLALARLSPLSEDDKERSHQTGCNFVFSHLNKDYIQLIGDEIMFRTPSGLQICPMTNANAFMEAKGAAAICNGISLKLRSTGRTIEYPSSDSSGGTARLTIGQGRVSRTLHGYWSVAC